MFPRRFRPVGSLTAALAVLVAAPVWNSPSDAYVNQVVIDQMATVNFNPIPLGSSVPGASTSYTIYQGRIFGLLDPKNPLNAVITDINHASWAGFPSAAPDGMVQYVENHHVDRSRAAQRPHDTDGAESGRQCDLHVCSATGRDLRAGRVARRPSDPVRGG